MIPNPLEKAVKAPNQSIAKHMVKDVAMAEVATQFIGKSAASPEVFSSTRNYEQAWGERANTGVYCQNDIVMVSGSGPWRGVTNLMIQTTFAIHYKSLLDQAIAAGSSFVVGNAKGTDQLVKEYLVQAGNHLKWVTVDNFGYWSVLKCDSINPGINIYSGSSSPLGAALTFPTELSFKKGKIKYHYPVTDKLNKTYPDAEAAYKIWKVKAGNDITRKLEIYVRIATAKFEQYPQLVEAITKRGGTNWLASCSHHTCAGGWWEGDGLNSPMISCLVEAYQRVLSKPDK
jgi:hypothetical protein